MMHVNSLIEHVIGLIGAVMYCYCYRSPTGPLFVLFGMRLDWLCLALWSKHFFFFTLFKSCPSWNWCRPQNNNNKENSGNWNMTKKLSKSWKHIVNLNLISLGNRLIGKTCLYHTKHVYTKNAGLFQPKFGSNMDNPKCWVKNVIQKCTVEIESWRFYIKFLTQHLGLSIFDPTLG